MHQARQALCLGLLVLATNAVIAELQENNEKTKAVLNEITGLVKYPGSRAQVGKLLRFKDTALPILADLLPHFFDAKDVQLVEGVRARCKPFYRDGRCLISQVWVTPQKVIVAIQMSRGSPEKYSYGLWSTERKVFVDVPWMPNDTEHTSEVLVRITDIDGDGHIELITFRGSDEDAPESFFIHEWNGKKLSPFAYGAK
jgi:hypothetical protein